MDRIFQEKTRMPKWVFILVSVFTIPLLLLCYYGMIQQVVLGEPFGDKPMSDFSLIIFTGGLTIFTGAMAYVTYQLEISLKIMDRKIHFRFPPFVNRTRIYDLEELASWSIEKKNPFLTGIGLRFDPVDKATIYSAGTDHVLSMELPSGKKIKIGTRKPEELKRFIENTLRVHDE